MGLMKVKLPAISSFTATTAKPAPSDDIFKTLNSVYFDYNDDNNSNSNDDNENDFGGDEDDDIESIIRGAHSENRLFFEPSAAKTIAADDGQVVVTTFKESVAVAVESENPYVDFKKSMEEMVDQTQIKDWSSLEELLAWYLRVNSAANHAYIVAAFVDLLVRISAGEYDSDRASNANNEGCSSISSSSSVCGELVVGIKSSTSFSSAASSFNSDDHHHHQPAQIHGCSSPKPNLAYIGE